ncbi:MAG: ketoacyl-ACP synthase III [Fibrobacteria bacterium]|nr:ketoacyl-ACP synthase III [Fibrobacteria bacterium]
MVEVGQAHFGELVDNDGLVQRGVDTSDEWIRSRSGIERRWFLPADDPRKVSDVGAEALRDALARAGWDANSLDAIVCATSQPDFAAYPATACIIQEKVGARNAFGLDVTAACTGFVAGLNIASNYIAVGQCRRVALVCAELNSRILDFSDRNTCVLFGDGAAAVLLEAREDGSGVLGSELRSDGSLVPILDAPLIRMDGKAVYRCAVTEMPAITRSLLQRLDLGIEDVSLLVPHQANIRIIQSTGDNLGIPSEKVMVNVQNYGNTSSATIPIALRQALDEGRIHPGDLVLTVAVGAGMIWGANLIRW